MRFKLKTLMRDINVISLQLQNIYMYALQFIFDSIYMQLNSMVDKLQSKIYLNFLLRVFCHEMMCERILFSTFVLKFVSVNQI